MGISSIRVVATILGLGVVLVNMGETEGELPLLARSFKTSSGSESGSGEDDQSGSGSDESQGGYENEFDGSGGEAECLKTYNLEDTGPMHISGGSESECNYTMLGGITCQPYITCDEVSIDGNRDECDETYFEIADGWGGIHRVCGDEKLPRNGVRASSGARDLFLTLRGHDGGVVDCTVQCHGGRGTPDTLTKTKKKKYENRCICGVQNLEDRIVNGEDAKKFEFPWQAAIVDYGTRSPMCGASLINDRWILTATHCFFFSNTSADEIQVLLHAHVLEFTELDSYSEKARHGQAGFIKGAGWNLDEVTDEQERTIRLDITEIIMHPLFTDDLDFDVALLRIAHPLDLASIEATPVCLPKIGDLRDFVGTTPKVVGWGLPEELAGATTRLLQKLDVPLISNADCSAWMGMDVPQRSLCAGYQGGIRDACTGDSGGPLILKQPNGQFMQIGVVSWGEGCARENRPGVYSRVTDLADFVQWHVRKSNPIWCRESMEDEGN